MENGTGPSTPATGLRSFLTSQVMSGLAFLLLNIILVFLNWFLPQYLSRPALDVASFSVILDEDEVSATPEERNLINEHIPREPYAYTSRCYDVWRDKGIVASNCAEDLRPIFQAIEYKFQREKEINSQIYSVLSSLQRCRAVSCTDEIFASQARTGIPDYILRQARLQFNMILSFTRPEYLDTAKESYLNVIRDSVSYEDEKVNDQILALMEKQLDALSTSRRVQRGDRVMVEVVVVNTGRADSLIYPSAILNIGSAQVQLVRVSEDNPDWDSVDDAMESAYFIVPSGKFATIRYKVSRRHSSGQGYDTFMGSISGDGQIDFRLTIKTAFDDVEKQATMRPRVSSFETIRWR